MGRWLVVPKCIIIYFILQWNELLHEQEGTTSNSLDAELSAASLVAACLSFFWNEWSAGGELIAFIIR